jgi:phosphoserine phosphatase RsbU/P
MDEVHTKKRKYTMGSNPAGQDTLYKVVLDTVSDGITIVDTDLRITFQNKIITKAYGGSLVGKRCYKAYRDREEPCEDCKIRAVLNDGRERRTVRDIRLPNGDLLLVELRSAAIRDEKGYIIGAVEVARDVTEQKKAEALLNRTLLQQNEDLKRLNRELSSAAGYVQTVLPNPITNGPIRADWKFYPSAALGGDAFGYHWIDGDHFAIYLLDVSGHGWGASLLSVSIINVLRSHALPDIDFRRPEQVLYALNNTFPSESHNDLFFTIWYGVYQVASQRLVYASGGHPPALLFSGAHRERVAMRLLRTPNFILGGQADTTYHSEPVRIDTPARLYVFSDGVFDIQQADGTMWGLDAFTTYCERSFRSAKIELDALVAHVQAMAGESAFDDDFTILEFEFE